MFALTWARICPGLAAAAVASFEVSAGAGDVVVTGAETEGTGADVAGGAAGTVLGSAGGNEVVCDETADLSHAESNATASTIASEMASFGGWAANRGCLECTRYSMHDSARRFIRAL